MKAISWVFLRFEFRSRECCHATTGHPGPVAATILGPPGLLAALQLVPPGQLTPPQLVPLCHMWSPTSSIIDLVSRRPTLKRGSGETVYKKFGAAGMLEAPIRSFHFKLIM